MSLIPPNLSKDYQAIVVIYHVDENVHLEELFLKPICSIRSRSRVETLGGMLNIAQMSPGTKNSLQLFGFHRHDISEAELVPMFHVLPYIVWLPFFLSFLRVWLT